jgi:hypothetical protein
MKLDCFFTDVYICAERSFARTKSTMVRAGLQYKPLDDEEREQSFAAAAVAESGSLPTHFDHPTLRHRGQQAAAASSNSKVLPDSHDYEPDESEVRSIQHRTFRTKFSLMRAVRAL